jgi:hypothetical protein
MEVGFIYEKFVYSVLLARSLGEMDVIHLKREWSDPKYRNLP